MYKRQVVILADLSKKDAAAVSQPVRHIFSWRYNMHGLRAGKVCDVNLAFLEEEQKKHGQREEVRVLYEALTRAKEKMLLAADGRKGALKAAGVFAAAGLFPDGETKPPVLTAGELAMPVWYAPYEDPETFRYRHVSAGPAEETAREAEKWRAAYNARRARYEEMLENEKKRSPSELVQYLSLIHI